MIAWKRVALAVVLLAGVGLAATRVYFVEPGEPNEGKVAGDAQHGIRQTFVANVDSIRYIEWFVGVLRTDGH